MMREPLEEPVVRAVLVVDLEGDEHASAERNGGKHGGAAEHGDANSDALRFSTVSAHVDSVRAIAHHQAKAGLEIRALLGRVVSETKSLQHGPDTLFSSDGTKKRSPRLMCGLRYWCRRHVRGH